MAVIPSRKNALNILKNFREKLLTRTKINIFERNSKARAISDGLTAEIVALEQKQKEAFESIQLSTSRGKSLISFGETLGISKRENNFAFVDETELNLALYVETGTFGDINGAVSITVPEGAIIFSEPNNNELGATIQYRTTTSFVLPAADSLKYISARAVTSGSVSNVGRSVLKNHDITAYSDVANNTLKVINFYPILNGFDEEQDSQYKFRISQNYARLMQNSDARILLTALKVPGVLDAVPLTGYYGIGSVGVVVLGADNQATPALVSEVQSRLNRFEGPAGNMRALAAVSVVFDLELEVKTSRTISLPEQARLTSLIKRSTNNYFRSLGIQGLVSFQDLAREIQTQSGGLVKLGTVGSEKRLYKAVYMKKGFSNGVLSEREVIVANNILLKQDEYADLGTLSVSYV